MSKWSKLLHNPVGFVRDATITRRVIGTVAAPKRGFRAVFRVWDKEPVGKRPAALLFGFTEWKRRYVRSYLKDYLVAFAPVKTKFQDVERLVEAVPDKRFVVWGAQASEELTAYCEATQAPLWRMEDGFIRSAEIGAKHTPPMSLVLDKTGIYFDSRYPSDLETILARYPFDADPELLERAARCMEMMRRWGVSKYNHAAAVPDMERVYGPKRARRVLVVGQVEDDASILTGAGEIRTNEALLRLACEENPGAEIIYKPHPDVMAGCRKALSDPTVFRGRVRIVERPLSVPDALLTVDHVYTITSLAGMEAILRGVTVTCVGAPFYAGWGLTDDRYTEPFDGRRGRALSPRELYAGAYLLYPSYRDPETGLVMEAEQVIGVLARERHGVGVASQRLMAEAGFSEDEMNALIGAYGCLPGAAADESMRKLADLLRDMPEPADLRLLAAKHHLIRGSWAEALRLIPELAEALRGELTAAHLAGLILSYDGAKRRLLTAALGRALQSVPVSFREYATAFRICGAVREAKAFYEAALQANPLDGEAMGALTEICLDANDLTAALEYALQLCRIRCRLPEAMEAAAYALLACGRADEALQAAEEVIVSDPSRPQGYALLVRGLRLQRRDAEADAVEQVAAEACVPL